MSFGQDRLDLSSLPKSAVCGVTGFQNWNDTVVGAIAVTSGYCQTCFFPFTLPWFFFSRDSALFNPSLTISELSVSLFSWILGRVTKFHLYFSSISNYRFAGSVCVMSSIQISWPNSKKSGQPENFSVSQLRRQLSSNFFCSRKNA